MSGFLNQETAALGIVGWAVWSLTRDIYRRGVAGPLSRWLLSRGRVRLAMRVKAQAEDESGCGGCSRNSANA